MNALGLERLAAGEETSGSSVDTKPFHRASPTLNPIDSFPVRAAKGSPRHGQSTGRVRDNNPLDPCGACSEWLRKIAETNPDFKVVTFSNVDCTHVHVKSFTGTS